MNTLAAWDICTISVRLPRLKRLMVNRSVDFKLLVGGGLGAVPHQAKVFDEFVPEEELLPISQAISEGIHSSWGT